MITKLPTYCLHGVSKYALNTDLDQLFSVLYYKSWHLLSGISRYVNVEFQTHNQFVVEDGADRQFGGWRISRNKFVVLFFNGNEFYCHVAYYDGVLLVLKVYGERLYIVLSDSFIYLPKPIIVYQDIEAYLRGEKRKIDALGLGCNLSLDEDSTHVRRESRNGEKIVKDSNQSMVWKLLKGLVLVICLVLLSIMILFIAVCLFS